MYYVYLLTNAHHNVLYIGVTNNLPRRLYEHINKLDKSSFCSRYNVNKLVYMEATASVNEAIAREKEIKGWRRSKKDALINSTNPEWLSLNDDVFRDFME